MNKEETNKDNSKENPNRKRSLAKIGDVVDIWKLIREKGIKLRK